MKKRIEVVEVPASTYENEFFGCDVCDFESQSEDDVTRHYSAQHAVKRRTEVGPFKLLWFDTEFDAKAFLDPPTEYSGTVNFTYVQWAGPGWYVESSQSGTGRCRCGGCSYVEDCLMPVAQLIEARQHDIRSCEESVVKLRSEIEILQPLTNPSN